MGAGVGCVWVVASEGLAVLGCVVLVVLGCVGRVWDGEGGGGWRSRSLLEPTVSTLLCGCTCACFVWLSVVHTSVCCIDACSVW